MKNIIDIYPNYSNDWKLYLISRDGNKKYYEPINNWNDYCYVSESILNDIKNNNILNEIVKVEDTNKKPFLSNKKIYKVYLKGIWSRYKLLKQYKNKLDEIFELDVPIEMKYILDNNIKINKINYLIAYMDIETTTSFGFPDWNNAIEQIVLITIYDNYQNKYISLILKPQNWNEWKYLENNSQNNKQFLFFDNEEELLEKFIDIVINNDYDIIAGWNINFDLSYIIGRCKKLNIDINRLSPFNKINVEYKIDKRNRENLDVVIEGRFIIDLLESYKNIIFKEIPSYSLEYVSEHELGVENKKRRILNFSYEWCNNLEEFINYNIKDVELLILLNNKLKLIEYLEELKYISNLPNIKLAQIAKCIIDMLILTKCGNEVVFPTSIKKEKIKLGGGYVKEPKWGLYDWVVVYDFNSMYPSIMRTFNLSIDTICNNNEPYDFTIYEDDLNLLPNKVDREGFNVNISLQKEGIMPSILKDLIKYRNQLKQEMKLLDKNTIEWREKNLKQIALKAPINAIYGVNCYENFRLYEPKVSAIITFIGRKLNKFISSQIEKDYNLNVIYNDTDSVMVHLEKYDEKLISEIQNKINNIYVPLFISNMSNNSIKINYMKIEIDKIYRKLFLIKKRRYIGLNINNEWDYKGVDLKRSNIPEIIKICLEKYINNFFNREDNNIFNLFKYIEENKNNIELFQIPYKLSKEYESSLPQVRAAKRGNEVFKNNIRLGSKFWGIWCLNYNDIIGFNNISEIENNNIKIDIDKYKKMLIDKINNLNDDNNQIDYKNIYQTKLNI